MTVVVSPSAEAAVVKSLYVALLPNFTSVYPIRTAIAIMIAT
jgi:hypothetical protein